MKLNKFAYLYSKPLGNHTLKIMKKIPGNLLKKTWKNHGNIMEFCQSEKVGTLWKLILPFHHNLEAGPESLINLHISAIHVNTVETYLLPPATKLGQGNVFTSVCQEFCPQGGISVPACTTGHMTRGVSVGGSLSRGVSVQGGLC